MIIRPIISRVPKTQRGMATLTTALILLIAITLIIFSSAKVGIVEQKIAANDYRAKQALHAAQAALDRAVYESNVTGVGTVNGVLPSTPTALTPVGGGPSTYYAYAYGRVLSDSDDDGIDDSSDADDDADGIDDSSDTENSLLLIKITATGYSDDYCATCTHYATKTIQQYIKKYSPLPSVPNNPLSTGGSYDSNSNSISIVNDISGAGGTAIQAQGTIDTHDKNVTSVNGVEGAGLVPNATTAGVNGLVDTTAERDAFFENAFGTTKTEVQSMSLPVSCSGTCNAQLGNTGTTLSGNTITNYGSPKAPMIWVTGDTTLNSNTVIGSPTNPVVLVINGTLTINGGVTIYGFVYVTGNVTDSLVGVGVDASGGATVQGSIVSEESLNFAGTVNLAFNKFDTGPPGPPGPDFYVKTPGTWTD